MTPKILTMGPDDFARKLNAIPAPLTSALRQRLRYLTDVERRYGWARPRSRSVVHLGWADGPLSAFMLYDLGEAGVRFDPSPDEAVKARPFMEAAGTLAEWVEGVAPARAGPMAFRCVMAASFASPLVALLGVQTFIVYLWGRSRPGKAPTLKAAGSVWGDPTEGADTYFRTFADTPKSIVRAAALLHDIPVIIDELQSKRSAGGQAGKRQYVEDLLYSLSLGHERGALNSDRTMMRAGSWKCLTIATGEIPIVGTSTQQGAANRTLELCAEPFSDVRAAQAMHHLVSAQHGTAGRAFIEALRRNDASFYAGQFSTMRDAVCAFAAGHPQVDNVALLALADALAQFYVFAPGSAWDACVEGAMRMAAWLHAPKALRGLAGLLRLHRQRGPRGPARAGCGRGPHRRPVSGGRAMLRHGLRRGWRLVEVGVPSSCLNVLTGVRRKRASRAGGRARARGRGGCRRWAAKTLRHAAFLLAGGHVPVLYGVETRPCRAVRRGRRRT